MALNGYFLASLTYTPGQARATIMSFGREDVEVVVTQTQADELRPLLGRPVALHLDDRGNTVTVHGDDSLGDVTPT